MSRDYGAQYSVDGRPNAPQDPLKSAIKYHYLAAIGQKTAADNLRDRWKDEVLARQTKDLTPKGIDALWEPMANPAVDVTRLPWGSWLLQFRFRLERPFLSRDERDFHIIDNPVRRDRIFDLPFMAASSWKGCLRAALRERAPDRLLPLCGHEKGDDADTHQGSLRFFPSFFDRVGLEIINPHDRPRRVGVKPLYLECAPPGAQATFTLLYVAFDLSGQTVAEISADLAAAATAVSTVLTERGFGAKTSSGYGSAIPKVTEFRWALHAYVPHQPERDPRISEDLQASLDAFCESYDLARFPRLSHKELDASNWGFRQKMTYSLLRSRHPDWNDADEIWTGEPEPEAGERVPLEVTAAERDLAGLETVAAALARRLQEEVDHE